MKLCLLIFSLFSIQAMACLPSFEIAVDETICKTDADCGFVGDGCRTCGEVFVANRNFKKIIEQRDQEKRTKVSCLMACEACSLKGYRAYCENHRCIAKKK